MGKNIVLDGTDTSHIKWGKLEKPVLPPTIAVSRTDGKPFAREIRIVSPELIEGIGTNTRFYGHVISFTEDKGFGHITPTYSKARLFFHQDLVVNHEDLNAGQLVSFRVREDGKGLVAFAVAPEIETEQESEGSKEVSQRM